MKLFDTQQMASASYGGLLEKIELMRASLRWSSVLDRDDIQKLLLQCSQLRDEVMLISRKERLKDSAAKAAEPRDLSLRQRRQNLLDRNFVFQGIFGESPKLLETLEIAEKAAPTHLPVLIDGESGTGKELMAKVIHENGHRSQQAFISVNCGAIPENLIESELFGHKKGAFTGATSDRKGKFDSAHNGTIFLDEIGELPLQGQVKLLRVLQSQEIQRVGSDQTTQVNVRIVAATNQNLQAMAEAGTFREDLFYRLSVIHISLPPLRERPDEIALLTAYYCDEAAEQLNRAPIRISPRLTQFLQNYTYPGNIRELRNLIYRLSCLADATAEIRHLPEALRSQPGTPTSIQTPDRDNQETVNSLSELKKTASDAAEKQYLEAQLGANHGNVAQLARDSGMNRSHLQKLLKKHGLSSKDFRIRHTHQ